MSDKLPADLEARLEEALPCSGWQLSHSANRWAPTGDHRCDYGCLKSCPASCRPAVRTLLMEVAQKQREVDDTLAVEVWDAVVTDVQWGAAQAAAIQLLRDRIAAAPLITDAPGGEG